MAEAAICGSGHLIEADRTAIAIYLFGSRRHRRIGIPSPPLGGGSGLLEDEYLSELGRYDRDRIRD